MLAQIFIKRSALNYNKCSTILQLNSKTITMYTRLQIANLTNPTNLIVNHDEKKSEFFIKLDNEKAFIQYTKLGNIIKLEETQVPDIFSGKGVGKMLAKAAFDYSAKNNLQMDLICTYLQHYYEKYGTEYKPYVKQQ